MTQSSRQPPERLWITGASRSGKTTRLIEQFQQWMAGRSPSPDASDPAIGVWLFAATSDTRMALMDRLTTATEGRYPVYSTTPLAFVQTEVTLFYPLLVQALNLNPHFPLHLSPENELELATQRWREGLDRIISRVPGVNEARLVRRILDLSQLAAVAGIPLADVPSLLEQGLNETDANLPLSGRDVGAWLEQWRDWCLQQGVLSYGLMAELYAQHLLPLPRYQARLAERCQILLADDLDEYPAIAAELFSVLLPTVSQAAFTFNPDGAIRLGLGADPSYLATLADECVVVPLRDRPVPNLETDCGEAIVAFVTDPLAFTLPSEAVQSIQTASRAELLRRTAEAIVSAVTTQSVQPSEIAVIAPGLDDIARYALTNILSEQGIPVRLLNEQRPLTSFPTIRALLTLLALIYGLGRWVDRDAIAELLSVLHIDPVRAGLLADVCFAPHPDLPRLLPPQTFPRWDRLGYQVSDAYQGIVDWVTQQQEQRNQRMIPSPVAACDRAIQHFFLQSEVLPYNQLAAIRQLLETAQQYWTVQQRLEQNQRTRHLPELSVSRFIQLLRTETITANPYPVQPIGRDRNAVTLATVFQYRSNRGAHRWQFWLDASSPRWLTGVDSLFGYQLFLRDWNGQPWTGADTLIANEQRLCRIVRDLLARAEERVYLCHSDLATSGQEQTGVLLPLVNVVTPWVGSVP